MADLILPPWLNMARVGYRYRDSTGRSIGEFTGKSRTAAKGGDRLAATLEFTPQGTSSTESAVQRATLIALLNELQGSQNRIYLTNPARRLRGSFPTSELLTNNTFGSGTTGWSAQQATLTVADRVMRVTVAKNIASGPSAFSATANPTVTAYTPYVFRGFLGARSRSGLSAGTYTDGTPNYSTDAAGLITQVVIPLTTSLGATYPAVYDSGESITLTGDWLDCPYASLSRCALVDNGQNYLVQSDDFTTTWANVRTTDAGNNATDPLGTTTGDNIIEDASASTTHYIEQTGLAVASAADDFCFAIALKGNARTWAQIALIEDTGSTGVSTYINLSTGALGTLGSGSNFTNPRAFVSDLGDGWFYVAIVGRKTNAATVLRARILLATADATNSYTGDGTSSIRAWRGTVSKSAVPTRLVQTTTTAIPGGTAQTGNAAYLKGLLPSTNGLLLKNDEGEVISSYGSELKISTAALNSNAAGLGVWRFGPPLRGTVADNSPVIINEPFGHFLFTGEMAGWDHEPGVVTSASGEFEED